MVSPGRTHTAISARHRVCEDQLCFTKCEEQPHQSATLAIPFPSRPTRAHVNIRGEEALQLATRQEKTEILDLTAKYLEVARNKTRPSRRSAPHAAAAASRAQPQQQRSRLPPPPYSIWGDSFSRGLQAVSRCALSLSRVVSHGSRCVLFLL